MSKKKSVKIETEEEVPEEETPDTADAAEEVDIIELTPRDAEEVELSELDTALKEAVDLRDKMARLQAESDNFRKRLLKDKADAIQFANQKLIRELVSIFGNLERALEAPDSNPDSLKEGVKMIADQFLALLKKEKVEAIPAMGEKFDPNLHEVLTQIESDEHEEGTIVQEYSKGYTLNGRVLLSSKVVIAKKPSAPKEDDEKTDNASEETEITA